MRVRTWIVALNLLALSPVAAGAAEHFVTIDSGTLSFEPAVLEIEIGDTVTWTNDGLGSHNVVADDASFSSGPPSTDEWVFSHTFHTGGDFPYHCEVHVGQGMVGTVTVEGVFGDSFEVGDDTTWDFSTGLRPGCTCYFSSDCAGATFCDYGPGGFQEAHFANAQSLDLEGLKGRVLSSSYSPLPGHPAHEPLIRELRRLFEQARQDDGRVTLEYDTELFWGPLS